MDRMQASRTSVRWDGSMDALVGRAVQGDRDAFGEIYLHLFDPVARYLYYRLGEEAEAEDVANDVFVSAYRSLPTYKGGYFPGWIFRMARNASIGSLRKRRFASMDLAQVDSIASSDPSPDELAERSANHRRLYRALSRLKEEQREVVVMKYLLGMTNAEVSQSLGKTENAVNAQQNRALRSLKKHLEDEGL